MYVYTCASVSIYFNICTYIFIYLINTGLSHKGTALHSLKRALHSPKRAQHSHKRALHSIKEP